MKYKFKRGDLVVCGEGTGLPRGQVGVLITRDQRFGNPVWLVHWHKTVNSNYNTPKRDTTELEINLFNLRRRYRFFNSEGEYYENKR